MYRCFAPIARVGAVTAVVTVAALTTTVARADDRVDDAAPGLPPAAAHAALPRPSAAVLDALENDPAFELVAGGILVSEPAMTGPPAPTLLSEADGHGEIAEAVSFDQAFSLHSKPGADRVIYLDLDGHTFSDTAWNWGRAASITVGSYSNEPAGSENESFSDAELSAIVEIWKRVAEDFAPWDVDVTTEDPGDAALRKQGADDEQYGTRVVITHDSGWYAPSGGVAYIGSFGSTYYSPAFVFSSHLAQGSAKGVAEAASHEAGHTLGLLHDGQAAHTDGNGNNIGASSYYAGHGDWAPIMGVGYGRQFTQWSKGEYAAADNGSENDLAEIDSFLPGRAQQAQEVQLPSADSKTTGTIETGGGTDTYLLDVGERADVTLSQYGPGGNLLAELIVTKVSGGQTILRTITPPADPFGWSHSIDGLGPGSYRIQVRSIGYGSGSTGFSSYGSIGRYVLDVDVTGAAAPPTTQPPPDDPSGDDPSNTGEPDPDPEPKSTDANRLSTMSPGRLLDTRDGSGPDRLKAGRQIRVPVAGTAGVADDAVAAVLNVVAVDPAANGYLSVTPCTEVAPDDRTSSLNYTAGRNVANSTIATLADDGDVCIFSSAATDVVVEVTGSIGPGGSVGLADTSVRRLADSRDGTGLAKRLGSNQRIEIFFGDVLDPETTAVALNLTAIGPSGPGFLTLDDCGPGSGDTAALNYSAGENRGNNGIFALSEDQSLCLGNTSPLDLTIDLTGQFRPGGLTYIPAEPLRLLDTREIGGVGAGSQRSYSVPATGAGPAAAASVNIASAQHPTAGFVTAWNCGSRPGSSALNPVAGQVTANGALVGLSSDSTSCLYHSVGGQLIVDLNGWWI